MCTVIEAHLEPGNENMFDEYAELYNIVNSYDNPDHVDFSSEFFQSSYSSSTINFNRDMVLVRSSRGDLIGSGLVLPHNTSSNSSHIIIYVHPDHRRKGIGSAIFNYLLGNHPNQNSTDFHCRIFNFRSYSVVFAMNHGFVLYQSWIKMQYQNKAKIRPHHQSLKLKVRELNVETELGLWVELQNRIFHDSPKYEYVTEESMKGLFDNMRYDQDLVLVAELGDNPIGICMGWSLKSNNIGANNKILQIHGMGILPKFRREGYASTLLMELMNRAYIKGHTTSELLVQSSNKAGIRMYEKIGFKEKYRHLWYHRRP